MPPGPVANLYKDPQAPVWVEEARFLSQSSWGADDRLAALASPMARGVIDVGKSGRASQKREHVSGWRTVHGGEATGEESSRDKVLVVRQQARRGGEASSCPACTWRSWGCLEDDPAGTPSNPVVMPPGALLLICQAAGGIAGSSAEAIRKGAGNPPQAGARLGVQLWGRQGAGAAQARGQARPETTWGVLGTKRNTLFFPSL